MERQYRDSSNLGARFSTNACGWQRWAFDYPDSLSEARLLELGCYPGLLWKENRDRVPEGWKISLTDASQGMLQEDARELGAHPRFRFAVVANNMLYHVQDLPRALSEIARVLRPGCSPYATTVGREHMKELGAWLAILGPSHPPLASIWDYLPSTLENGAEQLSRYFPEVSLLRYEDELFVTEAKPLVDYLFSMRTPAERDLASRGGVRISKHTGMFVARR